MAFMTMILKDSGSAYLSCYYSFPMDYAYEMVCISIGTFPVQALPKFWSWGSVEQVIIM